MCAEHVKLMLKLAPWMQVWDYIYLDGPQPADSRIPAELLQTMRREFEFWCASRLSGNPT